MPHVRLNGIELYHELHGDGPPLLLIAGLASDSQSWLPVVEPLARRFRLVVPDNRGCGRTRWDGSPISMEQMADDCAALLDALDLPPAHVIGHSMGGMIALELAARHPARVDRLVLAGTGALAPRGAAVLTDLAAARDAGLPKELWFRLLFPWLYGSAFFADPAAVDEAARLAAGYPYLQSDEAYRAQFAAVRGYRGRSQALARVRAAALVLCGADDLLIPPAGSERSFAALASGTVRVLPGAAHSMHWDAPAAFVAAVEEFLDAGADGGVR